MNLIYTDATPEDAKAVLRQEDSAEVRLWGVTDEEALLSSIQSGLSFAAREPSGDLVAVFGFSQTDAQVHPWLLSTPLVERHGKEAVRLARDLMEETRAATDKLVCNWVGKSAYRNRAFLRAVGFTILHTPGSPFDFFYLPPHVS